MHRSLLPFLLASLGFALIALVVSLPLFEWQISEFTTDFPSTYEVVVSPSPWTARLGDSLNDDLYVFGEISVTKDGKGCLKEGLNFMVNRSPSDKSLDQIWQTISKGISWLSAWSWLEVILSGIYIVWFTLWSKSGRAVHAIILTGIAFCLFLNLTQILRRMMLFPYSHYFGIVDCYPGTVAFSASLSKIHYETLIVLFTGIGAELSALVIILRQIVKAIIERRVSAKSAAG